MGASERSELSQIRTKREMKQLSIGSRVTLRTDDANEILAGLYPLNVHCSYHGDGMNDGAHSSKKGGSGSDRPKNGESEYQDRKDNARGDNCDRSRCPLPPLRLVFLP